MPTDKPTESWNVIIEDGLPFSVIYARLKNMGLELQHLHLTGSRHLECEAPVLLETVCRARDKLTRLYFHNIQKTDWGEVYFEAYPRTDELSLSQADYEITGALNLSDFSLLSSVHIGPRYRLAFKQPQSIVEEKRWELFELGIQLSAVPERQ